VFKIPTTAELEVACETMPLFPLPGAVFLPHTLLPLHVFESRYRDLIDHALAEDGYLAVPRLKPGWESGYEGAPPIFQVAGFGRIVRHQALPDGRSNVVILGMGRIAIEGEIPTDTAYRIAMGRLMRDSMPVGGISAISTQADRLRIMASQAIAYQPQSADRIGRLIQQQPEPIPFINAIAHIMLPNVEARQHFLELNQVDARIETLQDLLAGTILQNGALA